MSWLFIDTSLSGRFRVGLLKTNHKLKENEGRSNAVLSNLVRSIGRKGIMNADGVCVVHGPGSFSSIRTGVLLANFLSRLFKKPLIGVSRDDSGDLEDLRKGLEEGDFKTTSYVAPAYDREPNITIASTHQSK